MKFLILLLWSFGARAYVTYAVGSEFVSFQELDGLTVSRDCEKKTCEAYVSAKKHRATPLAAADLQGGRNPSSVRCRKLYGGKVVIGKDRKGNDQSLCRFSDGSYLR